MLNQGTWNATSSRCSAHRASLTLLVSARGSQITSLVALHLVLHTIHGGERHYIRRAADYKCPTICPTSCSPTPSTCSPEGDGRPRSSSAAAPSSMPSASAALSRIGR